MDDTRRTRACMRLIMIGLINLLAYTFAYAFIGGDAFNGEIRDGRYFVKGHFLHSVEGQRTAVSRGVWIYSYVHSISIWPSLGAMLLSMLVLARPHIVATYKDGVVSGSALVTVIGTIVVLITGGFTLAFTISFVLALVNRT